MVGVFSKSTLPISAVYLTPKLLLLKGGGLGSPILGIVVEAAEMWESRSDFQGG
jgi:hypothetical protein